MQYPLHKTVTKLLVQRLKPFIPDLIHPFQSSFIVGRKANDNVILTQDIIHSMTISKSKKGLMALKIDLEKGFDRLEGNFIHHVLKWFNFPNDWIELIMSCLTTSNLSVMINGERLDPFLPSRGISQGDPLSLYIFILCMEYLAELINIEISLGNWSSIKTSRDGPSFSDLLFSDNLILFTKVTKKNCLAINKVLETFCTISGQKVNYG